MSLFAKRAEKIVPEPTASALLDEAVKLLREAFGGTGNWSAPTSWVERKAIFLSKYEDAKRPAAVVYQKLAEYLDLIEQERECRPAEAMLADEIGRLRSIVYELTAAVLAFYEYSNDVPPFDDRLTRALTHAQEAVPQ